MDTTTLMTGMLLGCIGGGYFLYGKKQAHAPALISGCLLCILPYFIGNLVVLLLLSLVLMAFPVLIGKYI